MCCQHNDMEGRCGGSDDGQGLTVVRTQNRVDHVKESESFVEILLSKLSNPLQVKAGLPFSRACPARAKIIELSTPGHANKDSRTQIIHRT